MKTEIQNCGEAGGVRCEFLTSQELAARLKVNLRTIERWKHHGLLPYFRITSKIRYGWQDVVQHLRAKYHVAAHATGEGGCAHGGLLREELPPEQRDDGPQTIDHGTEAGAQGTARPT